MWLDFDKMLTNNFSLEIQHHVAPNGRISAFGPPSDASGSVLHSALRISAVRHTWEQVEISNHACAIWKPVLGSHFAHNCSEIRPQKLSWCRTALIQGAPESSDLSASNNLPSFQIRTFGVDLVTFEDATFLCGWILTKCWQKFFFGNSAPCRPQMVGFRRLAHRRMRQDQTFPAHFESAALGTNESDQFCSQNGLQTIWRKHRWILL